MAFKIDTESFSFITFGKKEKPKPGPTVIEVRTSKVAAEVLSNKNKSIWYDQNTLTEGKKHSPALPTTALVKKLSEKPPLLPTRSTSLNKEQEQSISITNSNQIKKPDVGLDTIYTSALKPNSSQLFENTPPPTENKSTSLSNAQSGIGLNAIRAGKAALKPPINPNRLANNIPVKSKKFEVPKIPFPVVLKSIPEATNQTARTVESIQETSPSELDETNTSPLSNSNAFEKMQLQVEIDQLNELLKDFGVDPIK